MKAARRRRSHGEAVKHMSETLMRELKHMCPDSGLPV